MEMKADLPRAYRLLTKPSLKGMSAAILIGVGLRPIWHRLLIIKS